MGLTFLAPLFLAGILALAIPVLIHLTHRERRDAVRFPSLMFLRRVPFKTTRRQRIRHWLLFLLRAAAVALLVLAFARPLLEGGVAGAVRVGAAREIVVLLDRSYSMGYADRWERARDGARDAVEGLGPDDRVTLVTFADGAEAATPRTGDPAVVRAALDRTQLGGGTTRYAPALQVARDLLEASELPRRELVLITDFQRTGWQEPPALRLPAGTRMTRVDLSTAEPGNAAVTDVLLERRFQDGRHELVATARVAGLGPARETSVVLEVDGQQVGRRVARVPEGASVSVRFDPVAIPARLVRGRVALEDGGDPFPYDDAHRFTVQPVQALPVLLVRHPAAPASEIVYLRRALEIGVSPPMDVRMQRADRLVESDLEGVAVAVFADAPLPGGGIGLGLERFVAGGGGLLIVMGARTRAPAWPASWSAALGDAAAEPADLGGRGGAMSILGYEHPVFASFGAQRSGGFSMARFFRYRRTSPPAHARVLARYDDGSAALFETSRERGRVLVWTGGLANLWNDLPVQPAFLPFVHESVRFLAQYRLAPPWYRAGETLDLAVNPDRRPWGAQSEEADREVVVETPAGERLVRGLGGTNRHVALQQAGYYDVRDVDAGATIRIVAVNQDPEESNLLPMDPEELAAAVAPTESADERATRLAATLTPAERERRQGLWWYLLVAVGALVAAETVVAGRTPAVAR